MYYKKIYITFLHEGKKIQKKKNKNKTYKINLIKKKKKKVTDRG